MRGWLHQLRNVPVDALGTPLPAPGVGGYVSAGRTRHPYTLTSVGVEAVTARRDVEVRLADERPGVQRWDSVFDFAAVDEVFVPLSDGRFRMFPAGPYLVVGFRMVHDGWADARTERRPTMCEDAPCCGCCG